jgi:hypothetical protein
MTQDKIAFPNNPDLQAAFEKAQRAWDAMTPEQQAAHREAQRQSYVRAEMSWPKAKFKYIDGVKVYDSYEDYCND